MPLNPGTRLGPYEIISPLGAGGMGEVYRALDTRLDRHVALKLVLEAFVADRERALRLEREAKTLAALNHPNIATLHGLEQFGGRHFLVMELVEGETLAERIARQPTGLPRADSLLIARQIAEALEAADEKGIVHRDLKPANVKVTPDDKVKVLDFGLAKVAEPVGAPNASMANSPTRSAMATNAGVILGTASYMSPEQARGYAADHRSDIFSFGVVLYEMLTGRQPFAGDTVSDVLAAVLAREPDLAVLPAPAGPRLAELIKRCLEKNPKRRWQAIGDVRYEIESLIANPPDVKPPAPVSAPLSHASLWRRALPLVATALVTGLVAGVTAWLAWPAPDLPGVVRFTIALPDGQAMTAVTRNSLALSPDGKQVGYIANRSIFVRRLASFEVKQIFNNEPRSALTNLVFSPDGQWVAFWHANSIRKMSAVGGVAVPLATLDTPPIGITWSGNDLLYSTGSKIVRVAAVGGNPEVVIELPAGDTASRPELLPDGRNILYTVASGAGHGMWDASKVVVQRIGEAVRKTLLENAADGRFAQSGHILYAQRGILFAIPFDAGALRIAGDPVPVIEGVRRGVSEQAAGTAHYALSSNGTLAYLPGPLAPSTIPELTLALFDRSGGQQSIKIPRGPYAEPRLSPDGRYVAVGSDDGRDISIWVFDIKMGGPPRRLTFGGHDRHAVWSSDSGRVAFQSDREGDAAIYWQAADGSGVAERLTTPEKGWEHVPLSGSADGRLMLFDAMQDGKATLMTLSLRDKKVATFGGVRSTTPTGAVFSPDGKWVAYSTRAEKAISASVVFVQPYPATGALFQVSKNTEDGHHQTWGRDGAELYYTPGPGRVLVSVPVTAAPAFTLGEPVQLVRSFTNESPQVQRPYDSAPQGFLGLTGDTRTDSAAPVPGQLHIVLNWFEELKGPGMRRP